MIDGYDCGIAFMDQHLGLLFDALTQKGVLEDLAIIISADHGENQGELAIYGEHATADQPTCRIPLIIRWPGGRARHVDTGLHYNLDLAPTCAELFHQPPRPRWDGQSFAPAILTGKDCGREYLVISQNAHVCQRSVRWENWLYIRTFHDGFHLFPKEMLFNLADDPHEQRTLAGTHPEICLSGLASLTEWQDQMLQTLPEGYTTDPMQIVLAEGGPTHAKGNLKNYCARLEATDRGEFVAALKMRHPREFK
jgi:arylsulfatase A-like enzyme